MMNAAPSNAVYRRRMSPDPSSARAPRTEHRLPACEAGGHPARPAGWKPAIHTGWKPVLRATRASALLLVLWALILLSGAVFAYAKWIQADLLLHGEANRDQEARAMAHSGLALGLHPLVSRETPGLEEELGADLGFRVRIIGEGGRLNINWLITGEDPAKLTLFKLWLEQRGVEYQDREVLVDSLLDYVDGDDVKRLNGIEDDEDYHPANRALQSVEELEEVANTGPLISQPGWKDDLTIYSQGPIDVTAATAEIMRLLPGLAEPNIQRFITVRQGRDAVDGTIDDFQFKNLKEVQSYLGLGDAQFKALGGLIVLKDQFTRIISEGHSGKATRQVEVVARKGANNPQIVLWKE